VSSLSKQDGRKLATENSFDSFFRFETLVSARLIKHLYFAGAVAVTLAGILSFSMGLKFGDGSLVVGGIGASILGNVLWRFICEVMILAFRVYETLRSMDDSLATIEEDLSVLSGRG